MVHMPAGWFVVGLGRNGMEYSVLLIACLAMLAYVHWPRRRPEGGQSLSARRRQVEAVRKRTGWEPERPGTKTRYGCFLPDLTGFARAPSARLPGAIWCERRFWQALLAPLDLAAIRRAASRPTSASAASARAAGTVGRSR